MKAFSPTKKIANLKTINKMSSSIKMKNKLRIKLSKFLKFKIIVIFKKNMKSRNPKVSKKLKKKLISKFKSFSNKSKKKKTILIITNKSMKRIFLINKIIRTQTNNRDLKKKIIIYKIKIIKFNKMIKKLGFMNNKQIR